MDAAWQGHGPDGDGRDDDGTRDAEGNGEVARLGPNGRPTVDRMHPLPIELRTALGLPSAVVIAIHVEPGPSPDVDLMVTDVLDAERRLLRRRIAELEVAIGDGPAPDKTMWRFTAFLDDDFQEVERERATIRSVTFVDGDLQWVGHATELERTSRLWGHGAGRRSQTSTDADETKESRAVRWRRLGWRIAGVLFLARIVVAVVQAVVSG